MRINKVFLSGYIGRLHVYTGTNNYVAVHIGVAEDAPVKKEDGTWGTETVWHNATAFNTVAKRLQHAKKGSEVYLEGRLRYSEYTKDDGIEVVRAEIVIDNFQYVNSGKRSDSTNIGDNAGSGENSPSEFKDFDEVSLAAKAELDTGVQTGTQTRRKRKHRAD